MTGLIDLFINLDKHLNVVIQNFGAWTYFVLFLIIFCETGLVVTPILPGDSLLFAAGALAASSSLEVGWLFGLLSVAAVAGDTVNYWIGYFIGPKVFHNNNVRFLKKEYLERTHRFYEKYGGETIIIARFIPIIRSLRGRYRDYDLLAFHQLQHYRRHCLDRYLCFWGLLFRQSSLC